MSVKIQNNPFLPQGVPYVTQPGLFAGKSVVKHITQFIEEQGPAIPTVNPNILFARSMDRAKNWFSNKVDSIRLGLAKPRLSFIARHLRSSMEVNDKMRWIREFYSLIENNDLSCAIERQVLNLFDRTSKFLEQVFRIREEDNVSLSEVVSNYQDEFIAELKSTDLTSSNLHRRKIINRVFDQIVPRVVVLGHSQGGLTALQALQENKNDISMVLGLAAPTNGTTREKVPALWLLKKLFPMVGELVNRSEKLTDTFNTPLPDDSSIFTIDLIDRRDGVILPNNLNPGFLNAHHIEVEPRKAIASNVLTGIQAPIGYVLDNPPWFLNKRAERNLYHMGYMDRRHIPFYFSEERGSLLHEFAMSDKAMENGCRLLNPSNHGVLQANYLHWLSEKIKSKELDHDFSKLETALEELKRIQLPFRNSEYELAQEVLNLIS